MTRVSSAVWPLLTPFEEQSGDAKCAIAAKGVHVTFADGSRKLCATSGMWNVNLGYGNAAIAEAAKDALLSASYLTIWGQDNIYARRAADALIDLAGPNVYDRVLFSTSGGAANDAAMKIVRHTQALRERGEARVILGLRGGYHGLTFGSFALSDVALGAKMYGVDRRMIGHIPPNDLEALSQVMERLGNRIAGVFVEPVIGNGAIPLEADFIQSLSEWRNRLGFLLVADEIATGFGRAGPGMFASQSWPAQPDLMLTAKAMTNGTQAASAVLINREVSRLFQDRNALLAHAETQAGTPVVCASILATISEFDRLRGIECAADLSDRLGVRLRRLASSNEIADGVVGQGCMQALSLRRPDGAPLDATSVGRIVADIFALGALVHPGPSSLLIMPAFSYTNADLDELETLLAEGLSRGCIVT